LWDIPFLKMNKVSNSLLFTRNDSHDPRLGECVRALDIDEAFSPIPTVFIWGYPDDEGIHINGGRKGAAQAPDQIRKFLYKMSPHLHSSKSVTIGDLGNIAVEKMPLPDRHEKGKKLAQSITETQIPWIALGGGHDYGYSDCAGFLEHWRRKKVRPLIINFDAHLDVRPTDRGLHSGTPFFRILTEYPKQFDFLEVGIQPQCNSRSHFTWCQNQGGWVITIEDINKSNLLSCLQEKMGQLPSWNLGDENSITFQRPCFISLDMDVFSSDTAPGCSQSWAMGLTFKEFILSLNWLRQTTLVNGLGIYECSPGLDQDDRTSKLAALLAHQFIYPVQT